MQRDEAARMLAEHMVAAEPVHETILTETIESAERGTPKEAGRTACGSVEALRGPGRRFPQAVDLAGCPPVQAMGIWHTHTVREELRDPVHSVPDWANVVFGQTDVSVVVGTRSMEVIVAADDREAMLRGYQDALGLEVNSKQDVLNALVSGAIPDPIRATEPIRARLSPLVSRQHVHFPALDARAEALPTIEQLQADPSILSASGHMVACHQHDLELSPDVGRLRERSRVAGQTFVRGVEEIATRSVDEALGVLVAFLIRDWLGMGR